LGEIVSGTPLILIRISTSVSHPHPMAMIQTILKVFGLSLGIAVVIKSAIAPLTIPSNDAFVLFLVVLPTVLVSAWLGFQTGR
jgi:hypothetical protein